MFKHMVQVKKVSHNVRNTDYELLIYQVEETGEYRLYVAKEEFGVGNIFTAYPKVVQDAKTAEDIDVVEDLISIAINDINCNEFGLY